MPNRHLMHFRPNYSKKYTFALWFSSLSIQIKKKEQVLLLYSESVRLSCSPALNGSTVVACNDKVILSPSLRPLPARARTLIQGFRLVFSSPSIQIKKKEQALLLYSESVRFELTVELLPHNLSKIAP